MPSVEQRYFDLKYFCKLCAIKNVTKGFWKSRESIVTSVRTVYIVVGKESERQVHCQTKRK
jgi:hypothetical protein